MHFPCIFRAKFHTVDRNLKTSRGKKRISGLCLYSEISLFVSHIMLPPVFRAQTLDGFVSCCVETHYNFPLIHDTDNVPLWRVWHTRLKTLLSLVLRAWLVMMYLCDNFSGCGGRLNTQSGSLRYPTEEGQGYDHEVDCGWVITTQRNKVLSQTQLVGFGVANFSVWTSPRIWRISQSWLWLGDHNATRQWAV